jgi:Family of unknown function (DUF6526)
MADTPQSYANHVRWQKGFHFFALPVLLINVIWTIVDCVRHPTWNCHWWVVVSVALVVVAFVARTSALKAQDRIIRLEERLRYQKLFPADLLVQTRALTEGQIIALRFASDDELEGLVRETLAGKFAKPDEIKRAIKNWRADTFRV